MSDIQLPDDDIEFLKHRELGYALLENGSSYQLIIKDYHLPDHYDQSKVDILIDIPAGYPNAPLDMFWLSPSVKYNNNTIPRATEHHQDFHGRNWQRWSRHGVWRPGIDDLKSFYRTIGQELSKTQ